MLLFQDFIILVSIFYTTTGQNETSEASNWTVSETSTVTSNTSESPRGTDVTPNGCDNSTDWHCSNHECIDIDKKCDGVFDCADASDEYLETCRDEEPRMLFGLILHCSSFWSHKDEHERVCPQICEKSREFCYYALMAENHEEYTCILPDFPINGSYQIVPNTNGTAESGPISFWLNYKCQEPQVVVQKKMMICEDGNWPKIDPEDKAHCSDACKLNKNSNFTYTCPKDVRNNTDCGNYVAITTTVNVSRVTQDTANPVSNVSLEILCSEDKEFHISTDCVGEVDRMQDNFQNPTMEKMNGFENEFNKFKANETSPEFEKLVKKFHVFELEVRGNLTLMHTKAEQCDISLDLLLYNLQLNKKEDVPTK